jgi:hypothetical protein
MIYIHIHVAMAYMLYSQEARISDCDFNFLVSRSVESSGRIRAGDIGNSYIHRNFVSHSTMDLNGY